MDKDETKHSKMNELIVDLQTLIRQPPDCCGFDDKSWYRITFIISRQQRYTSNSLRSGKFPYGVREGAAGRTVLAWFTALRVLSASAKKSFPVI